MSEMFMSLVRHWFDKPASGVHSLNGPCPSCSWQVLEWGDWQWSWFSAVSLQVSVYRCSCKLVTQRRCPNSFRSFTSNSSSDTAHIALLRLIYARLSIRARVTSTCGCWSSYSHQSQESPNQKLTKWISHGTLCLADQHPILLQYQRKFMATGTRNFSWVQIPVFSRSFSFYVIVYWGNVVFLL